MSVQEIERAIEALPEKDVHTLTDWLVEHRHQLWDQQIKEDIRQGRTSPL